MLRRALSPFLAAFVLGSGVVAPALDRGVAEGATVESEHHPSACVHGHDHTICTQLAANLLAPAAGSQDPAPSPDVWLTPPASPGGHVPSGHPTHRLARAPPAA